MSLSALRLRRTKSRRWRGCRDKNRYDSAHEAEHARIECERARGQRLRIYDCDDCGGWHLTSGRDRA